MTVELQAAVERGYRVLKVHEVWHYDEITRFDPATGEPGLFAPYVSAFMTQKIHASGFPDACTTEREKTEYLRRIERREGIELDRDRVRKNPGLRLVAKLCLNNLYGKLSQRSDLGQMEFVSEPNRYYSLIDDPSIEVTEYQQVDEDCALFCHRPSSEDFQHPSVNTNVVLAAYVTAHARLRLLSFLEPLGERALYWDTDSVVFSHAPGEPTPLLGPYFGDMSNELADDDFITDFVSLGPKNYAYLTAEGESVVKVKGFTLSYHASRYINFHSMCDMVDDIDLETGKSRNEIEVEDPRNIVRDTKRHVLLTVPMTKTYKAEFDKRVIRRDLITVPFGWSSTRDFNTRSPC